MNSSSKLCKCSYKTANKSNATHPASTNLTIVMPPRYPVGTVVWVTIKGFPPWPSLVVTNKEAAKGVQNDNYDLGLPQKRKGIVYVKYFNDDLTTHDAVNPKVVAGFVSVYSRNGSLVLPRASKWERAKRMALRHLYDSGTEAQRREVNNLTTFPARPPDSDDDGN